MRPHRVMTAGNDHCRTAEFRQHVPHIGARQSAEGKTEAHRIVGEIPPEIGFVSFALTELWRIGQSKRRRQRGAHAFTRGERGALIQYCGAARIDAGRGIAQNQRPDALRIFSAKPHPRAPAAPTGTEGKSPRRRSPTASPPEPPTHQTVADSGPPFSQTPPPPPRWS